MFNQLFFLFVVRVYLSRPELLSRDDIYLGGVYYYSIIYNTILFIYIVLFSVLYLSRETITGVLFTISRFRLSDDEYRKDIVLMRVAAGFFGNAHNSLIDMFAGRLLRARGG